MDDDLTQNGGLGQVTAPRRIMIIGAPGSGKSTLARILGAHYDIPVYHMDRAVHWLPGWKERPLEEKTPIVKLIVQEEAWVFEGGHATTYPDRAARADLLIWLDLSLPLRLFRVIRRTLRDRGRVRPDCQDECPERINMLPELISFNLRTRKTAKVRQQAAFDAFGKEKHRLTTRKAVAEFIAQLPGKAGSPQSTGP